jgi:uncharacterized protein YsxB (DUF464 family)
MFRPVASDIVCGGVSAIFFMLSILIFADLLLIEEKLYYVITAAIII